VYPPDFQIEDLSAGGDLIPITKYIGTSDLEIFKPFFGICANFAIENLPVMKIKKVRLSDKDKRKAYRTAVRNAIKESGIDRQTRSVAYRNRKKYTRKGRAVVIRDDESAG